MSKLLAKCAQNIEKGSRANFGHYVKQIGAMEQDEDQM